MGWGGVLTSSRPRPWYYVVKACSTNWDDLDDLDDATWCYVDSTLGWGGVGYGGIVTGFPVRLPGHGVVNPHLEEKTFQWLWRHNLNMNEKFTLTQMCQELGKLCKWRAWVWKMTLTPPHTSHPPRRDLVFFPYRLVSVVFIAPQTPPLYKIAISVLFVFTQKISLRMNSSWSWKFCRRKAWKTKWQCRANLLRSPLWNRGAGASFLTKGTRCSQLHFAPAYFFKGETAIYGHLKPPMVAEAKNRSCQGRSA